MIDFNEVVVFIKVVDSGSFSGASKTLGFPRSTVSRKVSQLETALGIRLLHRSTRKLSLTPAGHDYYEKCSRAFMDIDQANQEITESQQSPAGLLRIAAPLASQNGFLCDWINEFLLLYENVNADIILSDENTDMIAEGVDVAFRAGVLQESSLIARKLLNTQLVLCASPTYLKNAPALTSVNSLKNHQGISFGSNRNKTSWRLQNEKNITFVQLSDRVIVNSMEYAVQACLAGLGVALAPLAIVSPYLESNKLKRIFEDYVSDVGGIYIVYPSKIHLSITVRTFIDFIVEKSKGDIYWERKK